VGCHFSVVLAGNRVARLVGTLCKRTSALDIFGIGHRASPSETTPQTQIVFGMLCRTSEHGFLMSSSLINKGRQCPDRSPYDCVAVFPAQIIGHLQISLCSIPESRMLKRGCLPTPRAPLLSGLNPHHIRSPLAVVVMEPLLNVCPEEPLPARQYENPRGRDWTALMVDVDPDDLKNCTCDFPARFYVHPDHYRPVFRTAHQCWVRIKGKHRNRTAAWNALEGMMATRH
jgi:hypothetical protein